MNSPPLFSTQDIACERNEHTLFQGLGSEPGAGAGAALLVRHGNGCGTTGVLDVHGVALVEGLIRVQAPAGGMDIMTTRQPMSFDGLDPKSASVGD